MRLHASSLNEQPTKLSFEEESGAVLEKVRSSLAGVVGALQPPVRRASELQKTLGLEKALSWGLFNAATTTDPRLVATLLPGERSMRRFFKLAEEAGVPSDVVDRAAEAFEELEQAIQRHATDRDAFTAMVACLGSSAADDVGGVDAKNKRAAFRANATLWGKEAASIVAVSIIHPSSTSALMDRATIFGAVDLRQTRSGVSLRQIRHVKRAARNAGEPDVAPSVEPLDPRETGPDNVGLLRDFCSQPLPEFRRLDRPNHICQELVSRGLGKSAALTAYTGHVLRACTAAPGSAAGAMMRLNMSFSTPCELAIYDVLMHESAWDDRVPDVQMHGYQLGDTMPEGEEAEPMPVGERAVLLGRGIEVARTVELPRHTEMLEYVLNRLGWNPASFRVFRCRIEYPVMYSRVRICFQGS